MKLFFSKEGLKKNIGSYILLGIMGLNIVLIIYMENKNDEKRNPKIKSKREEKSH